MAPLLRNSHEVYQHRKSLIDFNIKLKLTWPVMNYFLQNYNEIQLTFNWPSLRPPLCVCPAPWDWACGTEWTSGSQEAPVWGSVTDSPDAASATPWCISSQKCQSPERTMEVLIRCLLRNDIRVLQNHLDSLGQILWLIKGSWTNNLYFYLYDE